MKRYRVLHVDFDSRAFILSEEIKDEWEKEVKKHWRDNRKNAEERLAAEYGSHAFQTKHRNFIDFGDLPFSVIAFHTKFLHQIRNSFVVGAYYPALTATCSLGERILNHLMLSLRDNFKGTPEYKYVYRKKSFDDWDLAINTLASWNVLLPNVITHYKELKLARNRAIHFQPNVDTNDRELALEAIKLLLEIIGEQFGAGAGGYYQSWFIEDTKGAFFLKKDYEDHPFVKEVYIPNCCLVGYKYKLEYDGQWFTPVDDHDYGEGSITDEEFSKLLEEGKS